MFLSSKHELFVLFGTFAGGVALGLVFDIFRIMRRSFRCANRCVWLQDILLWLCALAVVCVTLYVTNSAGVRLYEFFGFGAGAASYMATVSRFVVKGATAVISFLKKIVRTAVAALTWPFSMLIKIVSPVFLFIGKTKKCIGSKVKGKIAKIHKIFKKKSLYN